MEINEKLKKLEISKNSQLHLPMIGTKRKDKKDKKKYLSDQMQLFELLQLRCEEITSNLSKVIESILLLQSHLKSINNTTPVGADKNSMYQLINSSSSYQGLIADKLKVISSSYDKLSKEITSNILLDDTTFSEVQEIKKLQEDKKTNIYHYAALSSFCSRVEQIIPSLDKGREFETTANRIVKEFRDDCELNQIYSSKTLKEINETERLGEDQIPVAIERIMTTLYFSKGDKTTLFRLSADTERVNKCYESIRSLDYKSLDNTMLSSLLKKFIRDLPEPIWPEEFLQQLITCMESENKTKVIVSIRTLINKIPPQNKTFLRKLVALCHEVISCKDSKMTSQSIAVCLAPGLMRKKDMGCTSIAVVAPVLNNALTLMIEHQASFFGNQPTLFQENNTDLFGLYSNVFDASSSNEINEETTLNLDPRVLRGTGRKRKPTLLSSAAVTIAPIAEPEAIQRSNSLD